MQFEGPVLVVPCRMPGWCNLRVLFWDIPLCASCDACVHKTHNHYADIFKNYANSKNTICMYYRIIPEVLTSSNIPVVHLEIMLGISSLFAISCIPR